MNTTNKRFLEALRASLRKQNVDWTGLSENDWRELFRLADSQGVLPLIYQATYNCPSAKEHENIMKAYFNVVSEQVAMQAIKTADFLEVYQKLCQSGVKPLIVKGLICRNLYPFPDYRLSTDEDVFIQEKQFAICHKEFMDYGLQLLEEDEDIMAAHEVAYWKKITFLYIELHKSLFVTDSDAYGDFNRFFDKAHERAIQEMVQDVPIYTLKYTDHLFYLICHALKHFMGSGFGVRQVCDITLFANQYGKEIDWELLRKQCEEISAERFVATLFRIGEKHLTFQPEQACYPERFAELAIDEEDLLKDMLTGGVLGNVSLNRIHSSNITLQAMSEHRKGKEPRGMILRTVFPSKKYLLKQYKYLDKYPLLLPIAWLSRIWKYLGAIDKRHNDPSKAVQIGAKRVELLKKYGLLRQETEVSFVETHQVIDMFLKLIKSEILSIPIEDEVVKYITPNMINELYILSKKHDMTHQVAATLERYQLLGNDEMSGKMRSSLYLAVQRDAFKEKELQQIYELFEAEHISFIPLKGAVIRELYPETWMRTSCDIDILVREDEVERAKDALVARLNYQMEERNYHDISLYSPTRVHLELHHCIKEDMDNIDQLLDRVWDYAKPTAENSFQYQLEPEFMMFYLFAHMSYHFTHGGCGVRNLIDIWLLEKKLHYERQIADSYCEMCGIKTFADYARKMARIWMEDGEHDEVTARMQTHIMDNGLYGTRENFIINQNAVLGSKGKYLLRRIFMPRRSLSVMYPKLKEYPVLYPYYVVKRWTRLLNSKHARRIAQEIKVNRNVTKDSMRDVKELFDGLGL